MMIALEWWLANSKFNIQLTQFRVISVAEGQPEVVPYVGAVSICLCMVSVTVGLQRNRKIIHCSTSCLLSTDAPRRESEEDG